MCLGRPRRHDSATAVLLAEHRASFAVPGRVARADGPGQRSRLQRIVRRFRRHSSRRMGGRRCPAVVRSGQDPGGTLARRSLAHDTEPGPALRRQLPERRCGAVGLERMGRRPVPIPWRDCADAGAALGRTSLGNCRQSERRPRGQLPRVCSGRIGAGRMGSRLPRRRGSLSIAGGALGRQSMDRRAAAAAGRPWQRAERR
jgi:hypothetical protein